MEGQNQNDELYPIAVLIDELKVFPFENFVVICVDEVWLGG